MPPLAHLLGSLGLIMTLTAGTANSQNLDDTLYMDLEAGRVVIELRPDLAPQHAERLKELARDGFYDGVIFHRVIPDFMAQTGDPGGTGSGGSDLPDLPAEFSDQPFERGTIGMARTQDPDSANSQFFINFVRTPHLDRQYTIVGEVVEGMEHVDGLAKGQPPSDPDRILQMRIASDVGQ